VFAGQCRLITLGYRQGGTPGYGLRRQLLDQHGQPKAILQRGERKSFQLERVILTPGPDAEVAAVRRIYHLFTVGRLSEGERGQEECQVERSNPSFTRDFQSCAGGS
jgi:hypothetical protein